MKLKLLQMQIVVRTIKSTSHFKLPDDWVIEESPVAMPTMLVSLTRYFYVCINVHLFIYKINDMLYVLAKCFIYML